MTLPYMTCGWDVIVQACKHQASHSTITSIDKHSAHHVPLSSNEKAVKETCSYRG